MEAIKLQNIDDTVLMNRHNRQKRPNGRYLRAKCGQNLNQVANGLIVWNQPELFLFAAIGTNPGFKLRSDLLPSCFRALKPIRKVASP